MIEDIIKVTKQNITFNVAKTHLNKDFWDIYYNNWEESTFDFLQKFWEKNKTFIDIGAWIGPISLVASNYSKNCICFEPDIVAYNEFEKNIKINNISNIKLENKAVSIHPTIQLGCEVLGQSGTRDSCKTNTLECKCISITNILSEYNLNENNISVIKIDVEGHETEILQDKALWDLNVPMHISFHPGLKENKENFYQSIFPFLNYKGININNIEKNNNFFDLTFYGKTNTTS